jgi:DNA polymerase-3 subunit gamma/tau
MRDGLSLLDQIISAGSQPLTVKMLEDMLGLPGSEKTYQLLEKIGQADAGGTLQAVDNLITGGLSCTGLLDALIASLRDMMLLKASEDSSALVILTQAEKDGLTKIADFFDIPAIIYNIALFEKLRWPIKNSDNPRALLEASLLRVALAEQFMSIPDLLGGKTASSNPADKLKKNLTRPAEAVRGGAIIENSQPAQIEQKPVLAGVLNIQQIKENWDKIINSITNTRIAELLKKALPLKLSGNLLVLGFNASDEFTMKLCQGNGRQESIETILSGALGTKIKAGFEIIENSDKQTPKQKPPGAKTSQKTIDQVSNTPVIKSVLSELEGNIIDVEEQQ